MKRDDGASQAATMSHDGLGRLSALLAIFGGILIGWLVASPGLSLPTIALAVATALILLWLLQYAAIPAVLFERLCCWLVALSGFFGAAFFAFDLGIFTLFPYRIFLILLWLLFGMHVIVAGGKVIIQQYPIRRYLAFLGIWLAYALLSLGWAASKTDAIRDVIFLFMSFSVIFFFSYYFRDRRDLERLYWLWSGIFGLLLLLGFWEHLTGQHLPVSGYYGETRSDLMFRPTGVFHNPNDYATFLALSIPFGLGLVRYGKGKLLRLLGLGACAAAFYLIVITGSRANMLAVLLELVFLLFLVTNVRQKIKFVVAATILAALLLFLVPGPVQRFFSGVTAQLGSLVTQAEVETGSVAVRVNLAQNGLHFLYSTAGFGVGAGNAEYWMANFAQYDTAGILNPHNWWLEILTDYGIFVFAGYIMFYLGIVCNLWKIRRNTKGRSDRMVAEALLVSLVGFFFASISSSSIMALTPQWLLFAFGLAFLNWWRRSQAGGGP